MKRISFLLAVTAIVGIGLLTAPLEQTQAQFSDCDVYSKVDDSRFGGVVISRIDLFDVGGHFSLSQIIKQAIADHPLLVELVLIGPLCNNGPLDSDSLDLTFLDGLTGLTNLETLNLSGTQLKSLTLPKGLENLKELTLPPALEQLTVPHGTDIYQLVPNPSFRIISYHLEIRRAGNGLDLSWEEGTLQSAPTVNGPWQDVNESSPLRVSPSLSAEFFRVKP